MLTFMLSGMVEITKAQSRENTHQLPTTVSVPLQVDSKHVALFRTQSRRPGARRQTEAK